MCSVSLKKLSVEDFTPLQLLSKKLVRRGYFLNTNEKTAIPTKEKLEEWLKFAEKQNLSDDGWFLPEDKEYQKVLYLVDENDVILDIGAGNLALDLLLAEKCKKVYAVEVNPEVVSDALRIIGLNLPRNLIVVCGNGLDFPIPKDVNTLVMLLRHFNRPFPKEFEDIPKIIAQVYETWIIVQDKQEELT